MAYKDRTIELTHLNKSTFKEWARLNVKGGNRMSQKALEALYIKLRNEWSGTWKAFQEKYGVLLGVDESGEWGKGAHFKIRFKKGKDGIFRKTIQDAKDTQVRAWRVDFLSKGSPGTPLTLEATRDKFPDLESYYAKQLHHLEGIAEDAPYIDPTIKKILPGTNKTSIKYQQGQNEYKSFRRHSHRNNLIYGDKFENYIALRKSDHVPVTNPATGKSFRGSVHWEGGREGTNVVGKTSGHPDFSEKTYEIINKHPAIESKRLGIGGQYSKGRVLSRWDLMAQKRALYQEAKIENVRTALATKNPEVRPIKEKGFVKHPSERFIKTHAANLGRSENEIRNLYNKIDDGSIIEMWGNSTAKWRAKEFNWKSGGQYFGVDPISAAAYGTGKLIKENVTGALTGLAYLPLDPNFQQAVEKGSGKDIASAVAQDVAWGVGISQATKEVVNLGMRTAPGLTSSLVNTVAPHLTKVAPVMLAASVGGSTPQGPGKWKHLGYKSEEAYINTLRTRLKQKDFDPKKNYYDADLVNTINKFDAKKSGVEPVLVEGPKPFLNKLWDDLFAPKPWQI